MYQVYWPTRRAWKTVHSGFRVCPELSNKAHTRYYYTLVVIKLFWLGCRFHSLALHIFCGASDSVSCVRLFRPRAGSLAAEPLHAAFDACVYELVCDLLPLWEGNEQRPPLQMLWLRLGCEVPHYRPDAPFQYSRSCTYTHGHPA